MNNEKTAACEWPHCYSPPSKHAKFGLHVLSINSDTNISDLSYPYYHCDLCDNHIADTRAKYVDVNLYDLGKCPDCSDDGITDESEVIQ